MKPGHDEFPRQHPALDQALRDQIRAPKMDAAFRRQVFARIEAQRASLLREAATPDTLHSRLRAEYVLQMLNLGAFAVAGVVLFTVFGPRLGSLLAREELAVSLAPVLQQDWGLAVGVAAAAAALGYGLMRARLLGWMRTLVS